MWLQDRRYREGMGYRAGDIELHPGIAGEFGYDSNMYRRAPDEDPVDSLRIRITPSLSLSTLGAQRRGATPGQAPPKVNFRAGVAASYNEYIGLSGSEADDPSKLRNVGALADFDLHINPERPWGARLFGNLTRTIQPSNLSDTSAAYNRINAGAGGEVIWAPGGGLFDWRLGYDYRTTIFEQSRYESLNSGTHTLSTRGRWRFLPRTAFLFDAEQGFTRYSNPGAQTYLLDSDPLRTRIGLSGLVTDRFGFLTMVGWGSTFLNQGNTPEENYDGLIGQAQLTFYPTVQSGIADNPREVSLTLSQIAVGYTRDFADSYFGSFYSRDRGYVGVSYFFAGRVMTSLKAGVSRLHFPLLFFPTAAGAVAVPRTDAFNAYRYDASLLVEYRIVESVAVNTTLTYEQNDSKSIPIDQGNLALVDDLSWKRFQGFLGIRWFM